MEPSTTTIALMGGGILLGAVGLVIMLVGIVILIIRAIKKKTLKVPVIVAAVGLILLVGGSVLYLKTLAGYAEEYKASLNDRKAGEAQTDSEGNTFYTIKEFSVKDDNGNTFDNSTLAAYRYTVINMWEPWCGPCKMELPDLEKIYEDYKDKGINMIGLYSTEEDAATVIADNGLTYPTVYLEEEQYSELFGLFLTGSVPTTFVLDSNGSLVTLDLAEEDVLKYAGEDPTPELRAFYSCVVPGTKTYEFWSGQLDRLLG